MKKFIIFAFMVSMLPAQAFTPPNASIIQVHDMQMIKEQQFRREQINEYNDVKQEKERYKKQNTPQTTVIKDNTNTTEPELIQENGSIKIKY